MIGSPKTQFALTIGISTFYFLVANVSYSWNVESLNIPDNVVIWKYAVWKNRAFLAIPRAINEEKDRYVPTLVEVPWPKINSLMSDANIATVPFSKKGSSKRRYTALTSVTGLDVDPRGRLWILDAPDKNGYWPQIVIHDLKRNDRLVSSTTLINVSPKHLKTLITDPFESQWGSCGYVADAGDEMIVVYCLGEGKWWKLRMTHGPEVPRVYSTNLAISRKHSILYMTGYHTHDLFSINLENIRTSQALCRTDIQNVTVTWLGNKLGSSVGLFCDSKDGLHYFMPLDRASVRWDTKSPISAESHSVLVQSNDIPCITDYIMDAQKSIWGLVNSDCSGVTKPNVTERGRLRSRTVRIPKHSSAS
ncbi:uncharacterized protein LOC105186380 [Harpegnathos saltator]|uniref:uncharacterized protein LOC105186380 n=1 Tax=Harpegnathos saltator TaxID=610380 RepID=UPI00058B074E|nr:uncharacterized protein LOC105186380 [Harpegnathos saltator]